MHLRIFAGAFVALACGSAEPVDPHWSVAHSLPEPLQELHAAVLDGRVYVAGGIDRHNHPTAHAYRYDPATNLWQRIADLPGARHHMPLAVAHDTLYAVGGLAGTSFVAERTLWAYLGDRDAWEARAPLPGPRGASAVAVAGGKLVVVGGLAAVAAGGLVGATAIYDPATNAWREAAPMPTPRDHLTAQAVGDIVYAIGGRPLNPDGNYDIVEAYDPVTDRWTSRAPMPTRRGGLGSAVLDGVIHVFGGESRSGVFAAHEAFDPATNRWTSAPPLPFARHGLGVAAVGGKIFVIGGGPRAGYAQTDAVSVYTP